MSHFTHVELTCGRCSTGIRLSVITSYVHTDNPQRLQVALNELLVDYGWLPTPAGAICRYHADEIRRGA